MRDVVPGIRHAAVAARIAMLAALGLGGGAFGQALTDPTRPPEGLGPGVVVAPAGGPVLQSVLISPAGNYAIISGARVKVGQKFGDAVLVKVAETEAVLRGADGTQVLKLHPGVEKRSVAATAEKAPQAKR